MITEYRYKPTTHGRNAMAACIDLEKPLKITRVAFGSGKVDKEINLADVHELLAYVSDGAIVERGHRDNRFYLTIQFANSQHKEVKTFLLSEFIIYCQDPENDEETDLLYGTLGDYRQPVPAYNPAFPPSVFNFPLTLILSDEIQPIVSAPLGLPTLDTIQQMLDDHNADPNAHTELFKQYIKLDETGKIPAQYLPDDALHQSGGGVLTTLITIPVSAWQEDENGPCAYRAEVDCESATDEHIPYISLDSASVEAAGNCGLFDQAESADGVLRFWAESVPETDMTARAVLFGPGGGTGSIGSGGGMVYQFGHGLKQTGSVVSVNTANNFNGDNTLPISAAAVQSTVGNIDALLKKI